MDLVLLILIFSGEVGPWGGGRGAEEVAPGREDNGEVFSASLLHLLPFLYSPLTYFFMPKLYVSPYIIILFNLSLKSILLLFLSILTKMYIHWTMSSRYPSSVNSNKNILKLSTLSLG